MGDSVNPTAIASTGASISTALQVAPYVQKAGFDGQHFVKMVAEAMEYTTGTSNRWGGTNIGNGTAVSPLGTGAGFGAATTLTV